MTEQYFDLRIGSEVDLRVFFMTEDCNLGQALVIEGRRIQKALETKTSFLTSRYRRISNGQSVACDQHGQF